MGTSRRALSVRGTPAGFEQARGGLDLRAHSAL